MFKWHGAVDFVGCEALRMQGQNGNEPRGPTRTNGDSRLRQRAAATPDSRRNAQPISNAHRIPASFQKCDMCCWIGLYTSLAPLTVVRERLPWTCAFAGLQFVCRPRYSGAR
jgi:hypothetical protein